MQIIIDRFEGAFAVVELPDKQMLDVPKALFPFAKEGDVFEITQAPDQTQQRKKKIEGLMNDLFE